MSGLSTVHLPSAIPQRYSNYVVDGFFVPSTLTFQSSDFTSSEYIICIATDTFCTVVSHSKPNPELLSGIQSVCGSVELCYGNTVSHMRQILVSASCHAIFRKASSRHDRFRHLDKMHPTCSTNHGKISDSSLTLSCVLLSM